MLFLNTNVGSVRNNVL